MAAAAPPISHCSCWPLTHTHFPLPSPCRRVLLRKEQEPCWAVRWQPPQVRQCMREQEQCLDWKKHTPPLCWGYTTKNGIDRYVSRGRACCPCAAHSRHGGCWGPLPLHHVLVHPLPLLLLLPQGLQLLPGAPSALYPVQASQAVRGHQPGALPARPD